MMTGNLHIVNQIQKFLTLPFELEHTPGALPAVLKADSSGCKIERG